MRTKFDHISDDEIEHSLPLVQHGESYPEHESDLRRIAHLAWHMDYWKAWLGPPLTYYQSEGLEFDGQHRCRAMKFLARRRKLQIQIPLRYDPRIKE